MDFDTIKKIKDENDFVSFIKEYVISDDNQTQLNDYLESMISWVEDMEGFYNNTGQRRPDLVDWSFIATLFYVGKIYE